MRGAAPRQIAALLTPGDVRLLLEAQVFLPDRVGTVEESFLGRSLDRERTVACFSDVSLFLSFLVSWFLEEERGCWLGMKLFAVAKFASSIFPLCF